MKIKITNKKVAGVFPDNSWRGIFEENELLEVPETQKIRLGDTYNESLEIFGELTREKLNEKRKKLLDNLFITYNGNDYWVDGETLKNINEAMKFLEINSSVSVLDWITKNNLPIQLSKTDFENIFSIAVLKKKEIYFSIFAQKSTI